jgi:type II secretory pathway predicted ATPase ExeA
VYETHYGLLRRPFAETVDPSAYVALASHEVVLRRLRYALEQSRGPAVLYGPPGSGKTMLGRRLASQLGRPTVHVTFPALPAAELVGFLAEELGELPAPPASLGDALRQLRGRLTAMAVQGLRPLLVVDEAQAIRDPATFEALRLLLNFATDGSPDLSLLLVGGTEVLFDLPAGLADRLAARCLAGPLGESESSAYVLGRIEAARAIDRRADAGNELFSAAALSALHLAAGGLPRRLNRLADLSLLIAYARDLPSVDEATIAIAAREFQHDGLAA